MMLRDPEVIGMRRWEEKLEAVHLKAPIYVLCQGAAYPFLLAIDSDS